MARRVAPLTADSLHELPSPCTACLFWELGQPRPDPRATTYTDDLAGDPTKQKLAWVTEHVLEGHPPGRIVQIDGALAGYALFGPPGTFPPRRAPVPPLSPDALELATAWVDPRFRELGVGAQLLQETVKEALRLELIAVEVYGDRRHRERDCVLPAMWLLHEGFKVHREHPRYPLLRLDTRRTARWTDSLEAAWDEVVERLPRRVRVPGRAPVPHATEGRPPEGPRQRGRDHVPT